MNAIRNITVSYGPAKSRNQLWREMIEAHDRMIEIFAESERRFNEGPTDDIDRIRFACTDVLIAASAFVKKMGASQFGKDRLDELIFSFAHANWGRNTPLLARANMHPSLSPPQRVQQGAAQTCVELLRGAGLPAAEARKRTSRLFQLKKVRGLGVETLAKLGSRLSGKGAKLDPIYDYYRMTMDYARSDLDRRGGRWPPTLSQAENVAKAVIKAAIEADKARNSILLAG